MREPCARLLERDSSVANAGLVLDRFLPTGMQRKDAVQALFGRVTSFSPPPVYAAALAAWEAGLRRHAAPGSGVTVLCRTFEVQDRLIVGLGAESVHEVGIALHRLYGVPIIPGSALKGLARHYFGRAANGTSDERARHAEVLFGAVDSAAYVAYFDAWYVPDIAHGERPLARDVMTVHHPNYYGSRGKGTDGPWDFDDPNPVSYLSARGQYRVAVAAPSLAWAKLAMQVLTSALAEWGVGARTSSGYGRMVAVDEPEPEPEISGTDQLRDQIERLTSRDAGMDHEIYQKIIGRQPGDPALLRALRAKMEVLGWLRRRADKAWVKDLVARTGD